VVVVEVVKVVTTEAVVVVRVPEEVVVARSDSPSNGMGDGMIREDIRFPIYTSKQLRGYA
jgi:hypothetical protein